MLTIEQIKDMKVVAVVGRSHQRIKSLIDYVGIKNVIFCNNSGTSEISIEFLSNVLEEALGNNEKYLFVLAINPVYHYQILNQLNRKFNDNQRFDIMYPIELEVIFSNKIKSRTDTINYQLNYKNLVNNWVDNLMSEVDFWKREVLTEGERCFSGAIEKNNKKYFSCNRINLFKGCKVLDIGCGLIYKWGGILEDGKYIPMDPLAYFYNSLYKEWNYKNDYRIPTAFGLFEFASRFVQEKVDFVLIDNALDHCIDPLKALIECSRLLKVGGVISLFSYEDESVNAREWGLHKWNLSINFAHELIIWNYDHFVNVNKYLRDFFDFEIVEDEQWFQPDVGDHRTFAINMTKKSDLSEDFFKDDSRDIAMVIDALSRALASASYHDEYQKIMRG